MKKNILLLLLVFTLRSVAQVQPSLSTLDKDGMLADFDLAVSSLKEAHPGFDWYTSRAQMDSLVRSRRMMISDGLNAQQFYRILAPVISAGREGHCKIALSAEIDDFLSRNGRYPPVFLKFISGKPLLINDIQGLRTSGMELTAINGIPWEKLRDSIFATIPSDGFNLSKKYATLQGQDFAYYYLDVFDQNQRYELELKNPANGEKKKYTVDAADSQWLEKNWIAIRNQYFNNRKEASGLMLKGTTAVLAYHTFRADKYADFRKTTDGYFRTIAEAKVTDLIIDLRGNTGGAEGYEDYVFAHLSAKPYKKYSYVQASAFSYSFYRFSDYRTPEKQQALEKSLKEEHQLESDGRILRKPGILTPEKPRKDAFTGNIYVLISGDTYSGGSEFAALIRVHRKAVFIGEETGGGLYGNTSGFGMKLTLPVSGLELKIPLLKFVLDVPGSPYPFGHGVIPDYTPVETFHGFIDGLDPGLELANKLILEKKNK
ncbi:S41 family peptidase [Pedobacter sp. AW31-3R]|uniref:S41 family peptidase n=1 Tax=Pedobacter sp. AW31-3R TaxID=3445781 RepID=UPI003FA0BC6F